MTIYLRLAVVLALFPLAQVWGHGEGTAHPEQKKDQKKEQVRHWAAPEAEKNRKNPIPPTRASVLRGKDYYANDCLSCHGVSGDGKGPDARHIDPPPSDLGTMAGHHTEGDLFWKIKNGKGPMPAWKDVYSDEQIWDLVNYIRSLKPAH